MTLITPIQHGYQNRSYTPYSVHVGQFALQQQPIQVMPQSLIPVHNTNAMQILSPMPLFNPIIPAIKIQKTQHGCWALGQQSVIQSEQLDVLEQLQGNYETDFYAVKIEVVLVIQGEYRYALVHRTCSNDEVAPDQVIYEEGTRFTLSSMDGYVEAVMLKGSTKKDTIKWYTNEGTWDVWRRTNEAVPDASVSPLISMGNSFDSDFSSIGGSSVVAYELPTDEITNNLPELRSEYPEKEPASARTANPSNNNPQSTYSRSRMSQRVSHDALYDLFQSFCRKHPALLEKVVRWGMSQAQQSMVGDKEILELSKGRVWVCARLTRIAQKDNRIWQRRLDVIKGAYHEVASGVYLQPFQPSEPGAQHRLRQSKRGLWMIEEYNFDADNWSMCAQERHKGHWVDFKTSRQYYKVQIVPMLSILSRLKGDLTDLAEMKKNLEFLFHNCNPKKLNTKIKPRNLKHNMINLRLKIEKQHALSFAVRVAEAAISIALEGQGVCSSEHRQSSKNT